MERMQSRGAVWVFFKAELSVYPSERPIDFWLMKGSEANLYEAHTNLKAHMHTLIKNVPLLCVFIHRQTVAVQRSTVKHVAV